MRDDLFELASDLKLKKFFLAGHSMGGKTAISFALKWPELLNGLLIADISPFINENTGHPAYSHHYTILNTMLSLDLTKISSRVDTEKFLLGKIPSEKERGFILKNLQRNADNSFTWKLNASTLLKNLEKIMEGIELRTDFSQQISGFPVIFLKGNDSDYLPSGDFRDIQKVFPVAEFIEVPNAGHWIHADQPGEVVRHLKRLLEDS